MLDQKQLKNHGLRYARALQIAVRTAGMLNVDHAVAAGPLQQSFDLLSNLLKQNGDLTFGFVDNRVMVNNILTADSGLSRLEDDFLKRGVGAIKFEAGLSVADYKRVIAMLSTPLKTIDQQGGARAFVARAKVERVKFFPASKIQQRSESGDTVLEMDSEAFLRSRDSSAPQGLPSFEAMGMLFESAGMERPESVGNPSDIMSTIGPTLEAALTSHAGDPDKACVAVAQLLQGIRPDIALSAFPADRQQEVSGLSPEQKATELIQDTALNWAARYINSTPAGSDAFVVEEEVVRVLARSLRATQMSERLAAKLARFVKEYAFPQTTYEKIQDELKWAALPPDQKQAQLLQIQHYSGLEFRRLMDHLKELLSKGMVPEATELASHYLVFLDFEPDEVLPEELSRAPELITAMAGVRTGFLQSTTDKLIEAHQREAFKEFKHLQLVNALVALSRVAGTYEDYDLVQAIGSALEQALAKDSAQHAACCAKGLEKLMAPAEVERVIELYLQKRGDSAWARNAAAMLRRAGATGIEVLFERLEEETTAGNRLALLRLLGRTGSAGIEVTRRRLVSSRWYVVRNACMVLGELKDPELLQQLTPVLQHSDTRVQKAAFDAVIKNRAPGRGAVFAACLPFLQRQIVERALEEIGFLKDPGSLPDIERFVFGNSENRAGTLANAVQAVAAIPGERSAEVLARVLADTRLETSVRKLALASLARHTSAKALPMLAEFARNAPDDPLAAECQQAAAALVRR
jgi:HEAT repeat protein